ncbi:hypothetical protein ACFSKU_09830 [Pontibacter silvestris]|uniref:Uncharacterized protein n=1 Tax=Pontibacter silvestris TaxID=2305183 RepID=A0ABW4WXR5_9BACT|nr:hypothetical protein [Pontibacter silvestris]MCC9136863.1 hypothetical protein [Pontibacter silvestris]
MFSPDLPKPVLFHPLKHHLQYIREFIEYSLAITEPEIKDALVTIGSSQLDMYLGQLMPMQISQEVMLHLQQHSLLQPEMYRQYLTDEEKAYFVITLSDATAWVLRWGLEAGRFVHLHPARYTPNTIRVKANSLKIAVATVVAAKRLPNVGVNLELVNRVRREWLELPPVKALSEDSGIINLIKLLKMQ